MKICGERENTVERGENEEEERMKKQGQNAGNVNNNKSEMRGERQLSTAAMAVNSCDGRARPITSGVLVRKKRDDTGKTIITQKK